MGSFGLGAVTGALLLPRVRKAISLDWLVVIATVIFAVALATAAVLHQFVVLGAALALAGAAWLALLSSFNSSAQTIAAGWVRGRALAVYMLILFGGMAGGSFIWGIVANHLGVPKTLGVAAAGLLVALAITRDFKLSPIQVLDLTPSMHWPAHAVMSNPQPDEGPLLVMIEYLIDPIKSGEFTSSMHQMRSARLRDGAIRWNLFVDAAQPDRYVESYMVESWAEHLRQHERVTVADRELEKVVRSFHQGKQPPAITHLLGKPLPK
jgi:MFS family permease